MVALHVTADLVTALSYHLIPVALVYFAKRRKDLAFNWMFVLFSLFILACGTTHLMGIVERNGGEIWVESAEAQGAVFFIRLWGERPRV